MPNKNIAKRDASRNPQSGGSVLEEAMERIAALEREIAHTVSVTEKKVYQLECLTTFSAVLNSSLDTQTVREKAIEASCKLLDCETGSLLLVDKSKNELYWDSALGPSGAELVNSLRLSINDQSIAGHVAQTGRSMLVDDVSRNPFHFRKADQKTKFQTRNMVCVPVI